MSLDLEQESRQLHEQIEKPSIRRMLRSLAAVTGVHSALTDDQAIYCIYRAAEMYLEKRGLLVDV